MPEGLSDAFDAPIPVTVGGKEYALPLLTMDDLTAIGRVIQERAKQKALKGLGLTAPPAQRQAVINDYDARESQIGELTSFLFTPTGSVEFLRRSLAKAGVKGDDAKAVIDRYGRENGAQSVVILARRISGIFPPERQQPEPEQQGGDDPNSQAGASEAPATGDTTP